MRRTAPLLALVLFVAGSWWLAAGSYADDCYYDIAQGQLLCSASGGSTGPTADPPRERPPNRYLYESIDVTGADCHYWSPVAGGIDTWNPANDPTVIWIVTTTPVCPVVTDPSMDLAWRIFRSFPLAIPDPSLEPPGAGITGLPTYLATPDPADITHTEVLPDGRKMEVRASVATLSVDWGDGAAGRYESGEASPYPSGSVTHTYTTKTCDPAYRRDHPSGGNCHLTLEEYPITATFAWAGRYRIGGAWIDLGTLTRTATTAYDVDEVQGVLEP